MKNQKMYEADDKMISLIRDNYDLLQSLGGFGINLGFGDKTVKDVRSVMFHIPLSRLRMTTRSVSLLYFTIWKQAMPISLTSSYHTSAGN